MWSPGTTLERTTFATFTFVLGILCCICYFLHEFFHKMKNTDWLCSGSLPRRSPKRTCGPFIFALVCVLKPPYLNVPMALSGPKPVIDFLFISTCTHPTTLLERTYVFVQLENTLLVISRNNVPGIAVRASKVARWEYGDSEGHSRKLSDEW